MIKFIFSSKKQLFSKLHLHSPNLCPPLGLELRVWRLGSRDKGLGFRFRVQGLEEIYRGFGEKLGGGLEKSGKTLEKKIQWSNQASV